MKLKYALLYVLICLMAWPVFGQRPDRYSYNEEILWGANRNTTGGIISGLFFRMSRKISDQMYESIGLELTNIKHPQEVRWNSVNTGMLFIYGKMNYLYSIRPQYGRELVLFNKSPDQGVEIKLNGAAGPSFGLLSPYYVEIIEGAGGNYNRNKVPYDEGITFAEISGPGGMFRGLGDANLKIGIHAKTSLSFEMGTINSQVTGFEIGLLLDAYAGDIELMASAKNSSVFPTAFLSIFYGMRK